MTDRVHVHLSLFAGALAGAVGKTLVAPIDRIKIVYQVSGDTFTYDEARQALRQKRLAHGWRDWWRGNSASLLRIVPFSAIRFTVHEQLKLAFAVTTYQEKVARPWRAFAAGALAGLAALTATYPLDTCRARMSTSNEYRSVAHIIRESLASPKPFLYKGFVPTACGMVPYTGISFCIYELYKTRYFYITKDEHGMSPKSVAVALETFGLGILTTIVAQTAIYPLDIIRRRFQTDLNHQDTVLATFRHIVRTRGWRGLYNGLTLSWLKNTTALVVSMITFDVTYNFLSAHITTTATNTFGRKSQTN